MTQSVVIHDIAPSVLLIGSATKSAVDALTVRPHFQREILVRNADLNLYYRQISLSRSSFNVPFSKALKISISVRLMQSPALLIIDCLKHMLTGYCMLFTNRAMN